MQNKILYLVWRIEYYESDQLCSIWESFSDAEKQALQDSKEDLGANYYQIGYVELNTSQPSFTTADLNDPNSAFYREHCYQCYALKKDFAKNGVCSNCNNDLSPNTQFITYENGKKVID